MLYHIVIFKFRSNISAEETAQFVAGVESLKQIDGVLTTQCGELSKTLYPNYNDRTKGYTHSLLVLLKDADALEKYDSHPFHEEVRQNCIRPLIDQQADSPVLAFDYFGKLPDEKSEEVTPKSTFQSVGSWLAAIGMFSVLAYGVFKLRSARRL